MPILIGSLTFLLIIATTVSVAQQPTQNCDAAYPTDLAGNKICIPSPPPDLDCKDISYRNFKVLDPDPHNFDTDKDGIGCESQR